MNLDPEICITALRAKDARFDGLFFVGVRSTGIYCRPICTARSARRENYLFFSSAAGAEKAGFRPCLRCRPELAPGNAPVDMKSRLAEAAVSYIEDSLLQEQSIADLACKLGVTSRHLRRVFRDEFGVSPVEYAQTKRLLLAKHLLTDTKLPVTEIAFASGFSSLRRFNTLLRERYKLTPTGIRKHAGSNDKNIPVSFELRYRPPMDWNSLLNFLEPRLTTGIEIIKGKRYIRTVDLEEQQGWLIVSPVRDKPALSIEVSVSLVPSIRLVMAKVKRMFDLRANPLEIESHLASIPVKHPGLRIPGSFNGFETTVRAILGQQITVKAASTLNARFAEKFGKRIDTPIKELRYVYPDPAGIASLTINDIAQLGIISSRARSIIELARAVSNGKINFSAGSDIESTIKMLSELPGIGEWTAQYVAMRVWGWPDAFPHTDLGIRKALGINNPKKILEIAEQWRPWRAYAAMHLWKLLEK